jgi:hypothetical protein
MSEFTTLKEKEDKHKIYKSTIYSNLEHGQLNDKEIKYTEIQLKQQPMTLVNGRTHIKQYSKNFIKEEENKTNSISSNNKKVKNSNFINLLFDNDEIEGNDKEADSKNLNEIQERNTIHIGSSKVLKFPNLESNKKGTGEYENKKNNNPPQMEQRNSNHTDNKTELIVIDDSNNDPFNAHDSSFSTHHDGLNNKLIPSLTKNMLNTIQKEDSKPINTPPIKQIQISLNEKTANIIQRQSNTSSNSLLRPEKNQLFYIPCTNCSSTISIDEVESHSNTCLTVKQEIISSEQSQYQFNNIDFKLKKLYEGIKNIVNKDKANNIKNSTKSNIENQARSSVIDPEISKDMPYIVSLLQYISDSLIIAAISQESITSIKKIISNIDMLNQAYKGSISTLILLERARLLIMEKYSILREDMKKKIETKKMNERKSGILSNSILNSSILSSQNNQQSPILTTLQGQIEDSKKLKVHLELEKEMWMRKANSFKQMNFVSPKMGRLSVGSQKHESDSENEDYLKSTRFHNIVKEEVNRIDDIKSDVDFESRRSYVTEQTYSSCASSIGGEKMDEYLKNPFQSSIDLTTSQDKENQCSTGGFKTHHSSNSVISVNKVSYREFVKTFLKIKFKFNNSHSAQQIPEKMMWSEIVRNNISSSNWLQFIVNEFKNPQKYLDQMHGSKK